MKTLKMLALLLIILGFTSNNVNAQPPNKGEVTVPFTWIWQYDWMGMSSCIGENLVGTLTWSYIENITDQNFRVVDKSISTSLVGETSGLAYDVSLLDNENYKSYKVDQYIWHYEQRFIMQIRHDGKLIANGHVNIEAIIDWSTGEWCNSETHAFIECK